MPSDSKRKQAIAALVSTLAAITSGSTYFNTLTGTRVVAATMDTDENRLAVPHHITIRVSDGEEDLELPMTSPREAYGTAVFRMMIDVLYRHKTGDSNNMVNEMQDVIRDIVHAVHLNPTLSGTVSEARVDRVEPTGYDTEDNLAVSTLRVRAIYDYEPGVTI